MRIGAKTVWRWVIISLAALAGGGVGWWLVKEAEFHIPRALGAVIGAVVAGVLLYVVSGARVLLFTAINKNKLNSVNGRMKHALSHAEESYEKQLDDKDGTAPKARLQLAIAHLLQDEVEKSVQEFQQAGRMGQNSESIFFNNAGVALAKRGNITQSVEMFQKAVAQNGHKGQPHVNLAHAYLQAFADEEQILIQRALEEIDESVKVDGEKPVHFHRRGLVLMRAKRYDDAIAAFRKAMDADGASKLTIADTHNNLGIAYFAKNDIRGALMQFKLALQNDPGHGRALSNRGVMQLLSGQSDALDTMRNAAKLDPRSAPVRNNLGYALARSKTVNEGIREFKDAVLLDPSFFEPYYNLGKIYLDANLLEVAERNLSRAHQLNPVSWEILLAVAVMRMQQEHWKDAEKLLEEANRLSPNQAIILNNLATCIAMDGDYPRAQDLLEKATEIDSTNGDIHSQLGWVYLLQENVSMCANEMIVAIGLNPSVARFHNNYGLCQIGRGDYDGAVGSFRRALELDPDYHKTHYHVGYAYAVQNKQDMAIKEWEITERVEPTFVDVHVNLGVALFQKGSYEAAINEFKKVIAVRQHRMEDFSNLGLALAKLGVHMRKGARNREDPKWKESTERHKLAVDMFDRALALEPNNVLLHSNRGLACFFANRAEDAVMEWALVTKIDPGYARRREKVMQTEFDESAIKYAELNILERADRVPARTADYLYRLSPGYDTEEWSVIIDDQTLSDVPNLMMRSRQIERTIKALTIE